MILIRYTIRGRRLSGRKGQMWGMDFIIGLFLFIIVLLLSVKLLMDLHPSEDHIIVYRDAVHISDTLLTSGYPSNWTSSDVIVPGIAANNRLNLTQLSSFKDMDYYHAKTLFHVTSDFVFFIRNSTSIINVTLSNSTRCMYGYNITVNSSCSPVITSVDYENLVRIDRLILYNSKVVTLTVYAWN